MYLSPRTVSLAVPGSVARIELLFRTPSIPFPADTRLRVSGGGDQDELPLLTAHPSSLPVPAVPAGRICRQGALLHLPARSGPVPVNVEVILPGQPPVRLDAGLVDVRAPEAIAESDIARVLSGATDAVEAGSRLATLTAQAAPRLTRAAKRSLLEQFRKSRDSRQFQVAAAYDRLHADANARPSPALAGRLAAAREHLVAQADDDLIARHAGTLAARGEAAALEEAGRFVDQLRRVNLGEVRSAPGTRRLLSAARDRWLSVAPSAENYPAFLGITLIEPAQVRAQKKLLAARLLALDMR